MTWDVNNFATLSRSSEGSTVTFEDDSKSEIIGIGNIRIGSSLLIENVTLIEGLKHNLLSISQLCDKGSRIIFDDSTCDIINEKSNSRVPFSFCENNIYIIDMLNLQCNATCLTAFNEDSWLWYRQLGHVPFDQQSYINSKERMKGILNLKFEKIAYVMCANSENKPSPLSNPLRIL